MKALHSRGERRSGAVNYLAVALVGLALGSAACVDPAGAYSDFKKRYDASMTTSSAGGSTSMSSSSSGMMGGGGAGGCQIPAAGDLDGDYFMTIAANLSPTKVVSLAGHLTTVEKNGSLVVTIKAQALYSVDRKTPVGGMISPKPATVQKDGSAVFDFGNLVVDGCADALICGTEIDAQNVVVTAPPGSYCGKPTFICGTITGKVTKPIADDLGSPNPSTWTMQTWDGHTTPSKVVTDCAMDVADPPPTTCQGCP